MPGKRRGEGDGGCPGQRLGNCAGRARGARHTKVEGDLLEREGGASAKMVNFEVLLVVSFLESAVKYGGKLFGLKV